MPPHRRAYRPTVMGTRGAVASAHPLASMAGIQMLLAGGNAVDAAVAVGSTLNVVEPFMSGIGGIGLMLVSRADGQRHVLDFVGPAPRAADPAKCTIEELGGGPEVVRDSGQSWRLADRARAFRPAAAGGGARAGHRARRARRAAHLQERRVLHRRTGNLKRSREAERLYWPNGGPRAGAVVTYKDLATTFRQVAEGGMDAFYRGPVAKAIARTVEEAGGWLSLDDLAAFRPEWREPARITYRGREVASMPAPFSAFQMLETLNILEGYDLRAGATTRWTTSTI